MIRQRGVTLIEALVAMAVMAFGMLALVGVQSTLRVNADLAKQRAEATRLAEAQLEAARSFVAVGTGALGDTEYDNLNSIVVPQTILLPESNTEYRRSVVVVPVAQAGNLQRTLKVTVEWTDRYGNDRRVVLRDLLARAAPVLSGLVSTVKQVTIVGQRKNRHPTIPIRAGDLGNNESAFKPQEGGTVAWVFNNVTGMITRVCTVADTATSSSLVTGDLTSANCVATSAQLLAGLVRFNLRGVSKDLLDGTSVFKPVPGSEVAWIINNSQSTIVRRCTVSAASTTQSLSSTDLGTCTALLPPQAIGTFDATDAPAYALVATDSENPRWPALNLNVVLTHDNASDPVSGHTNPPICLADAPTTSVAANAQTDVQYFCIVYPKSNGTNAWAGRSTLTPLGFGDVNGVAWTIGSAANTYRVCRYTTSSSQYADNLDHPADYSKWIASCGQSASDPACRPVTGNLINQNFLVIEGTKSCPTDVAVNPSTGDLVNSNTLQHQP